MWLELYFPLCDNISMNKEIIITKANGEKEVFYKEKLLTSLLRSGAQPDVAQKVVAHVEAELKDGMSTSHIYRHAFEVLKKESHPVAIKYSMKRAVLDLGPSGFPFEDFVAEIFKQLGYKAETGKILKGKCVEHEVDVVAHNENKLIMVEAKFHNELGVKSDLKVALYVKARFDDLKGASFFFGKERPLDEGWLVTNTKFSATAIEYGKCQNMKMIGWNYPEKGNLLNMIQDAGLHPLTCLTTLTQTQKTELLKKGIVLCKTLVENPETLTAIGLDNLAIGKIKEEITFLK